MYETLAAIRLTRQYLCHNTPDHLRSSGENCPYPYIMGMGMHDDVLNRSTPSINCASSVLSQLRRNTWMCPYAWRPPWGSPKIAKHAECFNLLVVIQVELAFSTFGRVVACICVKPALVLITY
jgi:hypothetical protein